VTKARLQKDCQAQDNLGLSVYGFEKKAQIIAEHREEHKALNFRLG